MSEMHPSIWPADQSGHTGDKVCSDLTSVNTGGLSHGSVMSLEEMEAFLEFLPQEVTKTPANTRLP
jgi:hypothetical protein